MKQIRILIVEDEYIIARDLQAQVEKLGYTVCGRVNSGEKAFEHVATIPTDLVLMDIMLKGPMNGIEAATAIHTRFHLPVVYVTANMNLEILEQAKITEPFGIILKPFNERELHANIEMSLYKHRMEQQLRVSEEHYRKLIDHSPEAIVVIQDGYIKYINPRGLQLSGYTCEEVMSQSFLQFVHPDERVLAEERYQRRLDAEDVPKTFLIRLLNKRGRTFWAEQTVVTVEWEGRLATLNFLNDITERKLAEDTLHAQKTLLDEVFSGIQEGVALLDDLLKIQFCNPAYAALVGVPEHELLGVNAFSFFDEQARSLLIQGMKKWQGGVSSTYELPLVTMQGGRKYVRITLAPRFDHEQRVIGEFVTLLDITDRKQAEENLKRHQDHLEEVIEQRTGELVEANKLLAHEVIVRKQAEEAAQAASRAKNEFLANMSHELLTPMNAILGYTQILKRDPGLTAQQQNKVEIIHRNGERLVTIINGLLDFANLEGGHVRLNKQIFPLSLMIAPLLEQASQHAQRSGLAFVYQPAPDLPETLFGDQYRLRKVLATLLDNAVKFTPHGQVTLRISKVLQAADPPDNARLRFEVQDTGIGIDAAHYHYLFTPFERIKNERFYSEGMGLGLAICARLVRIMGGDIQVTSTPGAGSCFWFELDLSPQPEAYL